MGFKRIICYNTCVKNIPTTSVLEIEFSRLTFAQTVRLIMREIRLREKQTLPQTSSTNFWGKTEKIVKKPAFFVTTTNPEMCLKAQDDAEFREILNNSDLCVPDGTGILWASTYLNKPQKTTTGNKIQKWLSLFWGFVWPNSIRQIIPERVTGSDLTLALAERAERKGWRVFLLGAGSGVAEKARANLEKKFPEIKIVGTHAGSPAEAEEKQIRAKILHARTDVLFVAYGAPAQEKWLTRNLRFLAGVKCAIGVGGTLDFLAETKKRAPKNFQKLGLEWLWRLCIEPTRWRRIKNAVINFPREVEIFKNKQK